MNKTILRRSVWDYKLYIFDLDGTLYFQKPFRVRMLFYLIGYVITHPVSLRDMLLIKCYRNVREEWERILLSLPEKSGEETLDDMQYRYVAEKKGVPPERVKKAVDFFMMKAPLALLPAFGDRALLSWIQRLRSSGRCVVVYSDYPADDKLRALCVEADAVYTSADVRIGSMKPDPKGIETILKDFEIAGADALMIGDRYEKDGIAAERNGVDYMILSAGKRERAKQEAVFTDRA